MKKKLQSEIREIAHQLLKEETAQNPIALKKRVAQLYEKLVVLEYLEGQIDSEANPMKDEALDSKSFREKNWFKEPEPLPQPENKEDIVEPLMEKIKDIVAQMPEESQEVDEMLEEVIPLNGQTQPHQRAIKNDLEEFAARYQQTPVFERKNAEVSPKFETNSPISENKTKSLNEKLNQGLHIDLNDRLAFITHLFDGNTQDYSRVLSQINSMESFEEAENFIKGNVKPDYNYWLKKETYSERFMHLIEQKFQ